MIRRAARSLLALFALTGLLPVHVFAAEPVHKVLSRHARESAVSRQSESAAIRSQIRESWMIPAGLPGADKVRIRARIRLDPSGNIRGNPDITATGGPEHTRGALVASAYRSIVRAAPFHGLPRDRYNDWREIVAHFDASGPAL